MTLLAAIKFTIGKITISSFFNSRDKKDKCRAAVPLLQDKQCFTLNFSFTELSNFLTYGPDVIN